MDRYDLTPFDYSKVEPGKNYLALVHNTVYNCWCAAVLRTNGGDWGYSPFSIDMNSPEDVLNAFGGTSHLFIESRRSQFFHFDPYSYLEVEMFEWTPNLPITEEMYF